MSVYSSGMEYMGNGRGVSFPQTVEQLGLVGKRGGRLLIGTLMGEA